MPKKHLKGVSEKEQRQYEHIKESAEKSGRYGKDLSVINLNTLAQFYNSIPHGNEHA